MHQRLPFRAVEARVLLGPLAQGKAFHGHALILEIEEIAELREIGGRPELNLTHRAIDRQRQVGGPLFPERVVADFEGLRGQVSTVGVEGLELRGALRHIGLHGDGPALGQGLGKAGREGEEIKISRRPLTRIVVHGFQARPKLQPALAKGPGLVGKERHRFPVHGNHESLFPFRREAFVLELETKGAGEASEGRV